MLKLTSFFYSSCAAAFSLFFVFDGRLCNKKNVFNVCSGFPHNICFAFDRYEAEILGRENGGCEMLQL